MQIVSLLRDFILLLKLCQPFTKLKSSIKNNLQKQCLIKNIEMFIVYIATHRLVLIYLAWKAWIVLLFIKKNIILAKYLDFINMSLKKISSGTT